MSDHQLVTVEFRGDRIFAIEAPEGILVVAKPIAEKFGLVWSKQLQRLKADPALSDGVYLKYIPSPGGMQETTVLGLNRLNGWLYKIDPRKVKPEFRSDLISYQRECSDALYAHFSTGRVAAGAPEPKPEQFSDGLDIMQKVAFAREARLQFGRPAGNRMWIVLGLPDVTGRPGLNGVLADPRDGRECLAYLLGLDVGGRAVSGWIADGQDAPALNRVGLRVREDGLFLSHQTPVFADSRWSGMRHRAALLTLEGVFTPPNALRLHHHSQRGLLVPLSTIAGGLHDVR